MDAETASRLAFLTHRLASIEAALRLARTVNGSDVETAMAKATDSILFAAVAAGASANEAAGHLRDATQAYHVARQTTGPRPR